jgi:hypothetical protein
VITEIYQYRSSTADVVQYSTVRDFLRYCSSSPASINVDRVTAAALHRAGIPPGACRATRVTRLQRRERLAALLPGRPLCAERHRAPWPCPVISECEPPQDSRGPGGTIEARKKSRPERGRGSGSGTASSSQGRRAWRTRGWQLSERPVGSTRDQRGGRSPPPHPRTGRRLPRAASACVLGARSGRSGLACRASASVPLVPGRLTAGPPSPFGLHHPVKELVSVHLWWLCRCPCCPTHPAVKLDGGHE